MWGNIEKIQLVLPPPRRSDTYTARFASWPKPVARRDRKSIFKLAEMAVSSDMLSALLNNLILNLYFYVSLFLYCFLFELLAGMTQEKSVTGTRVVVMEGQESAIGKILLRTLIGVLLLPVEWLFFLRSKPIGWHDSESKTEVILK
jgi:hypothetical protein